MTLYPDIQRRAQEAIDKVVDTGRLPAFSDNIPYVDAIVREVLRWRPVTPLGAWTSTPQFNRRLIRFIARYCTCSDTRRRVQWLPYSVGICGGSKQLVSDIDFVTCSRRIYKLRRAILHDEVVYGPDTEHFIPERWLKDGELNPKLKNPDAAFGFGRRLCAVRIDLVFKSVDKVAKHIFLGQGHGPVVNMDNRCLHTSVFQHF
jgi:hypothetical protein